MKHFSLLSAAALLLASCSSLELYHMGGLKPDAMQDMHSFCVEMFENHSTQPAAGMLLTNALTDAMQRDGTYRLASASQADFSLSGEVTQLSRESLLTDPDDTYLSREIGLTVHVHFVVRDRRTGQVVMDQKTTGTGSYFTDAGNMQSAVNNALSAASRSAAEDITNTLTTP